MTIWLLYYIFQK